MNELWRIDELQALTEQALATALPEADLSGRVRAVPDARTIRYYTTIGLLDRAAEMRGRTAYYGRQHVLQLVCIKRLQAAGLSLEQVQQKLAGATTRKLNELASLPAGFWDQSASSQRQSGPKKLTQPAAVPPRANFWAAPPAVAAELPVVPQRIASLRLPLADGVSLEVTGAVAERMTSAAAAELRPVLEQLTQELHRLGLLPG